jgi:hypothetical protein
MAYKGYLTPHMPEIIRRWREGQSIGEIATWLDRVSPLSEHSYALGRRNYLTQMVRYLLKREKLIPQKQLSPRLVPFDGENVTVRAANVLANENIQTWQQAAAYAWAVAKIPNCGRKTTNEIQTILKRKAIYQGDVYHGHSQH